MQAPRVVVITGASSGVGRATARAFGRLGAGVGKGLTQTLDVFGRARHDFDCTR